MVAPVEQLTLAPLEAEDWPSVARIYKAGIDGGNATFETGVPTWKAWSEPRSRHPGLVAKDGGGNIVGWAALSPVSSREVYRGVGSVSIYVDPEHHRRGVAKALLRALLREGERAGFWTIEAGIFPQNTASSALHESCGFRFVGVRRRVGQMPDGRWSDVNLYEYRSAVVGVE